VRLCTALGAWILVAERHILISGFPIGSWVPGPQGGVVRRCDVALLRCCDPEAEHDRYTTDAMEKHVSQSHT
jgi:hypothetical protein